jgi:tetratricopeptide (TPR) repeat protein
VNTGNALYRQGDSKGAAPFYERALAIFGKTQPASLSEASVQGNLAAAYGELGRRAEALELQKKSLATLEKKLGLEHPEVAFTLDGLANELRLQGKLDEALATIDRAIAIDEKALGAAHPDLAHAWLKKADIEGQLKDKAAARLATEKAVAAYRGSVGPDATETVVAEGFLAELDYRAGDAAKALPVAEHAAAVLDRAGVKGIESAAAHLLIARCLFVTHGDHARACRLAGQALDEYVGLFGHEAFVAEARKLVADQRCPKRQ